MKATIDIGTNSVRLLVAERGQGTMVPLVKESIITRLGQNVDQAGNLDPKAVDRTIETLIFFKEKRIPRGITPIVIATSAVRDAENRAEFLRDVRLKTGWDVQVLTGTQEARLSFRGALNALEPERIQEPAVVLDVGGGSTELYTGLADGTLLGGGSVQAGAVRMTERFITCHPVSTDELRALDEEIQRLLQPLVEKTIAFGPKMLAAVGGTATSAAAICQGLVEYDENQITGFVLSRDRLGQLYNQLGRLSLAERLQLPGLQKGREDVIAAGIGILWNAVIMLGFEEIVVSDGDLLQASLLFAVDEG